MCDKCKPLHILCNIYQLNPPYFCMYQNFKNMAKEIPISTHKNANNKSVYTYQKRISIDWKIPQKPNEDAATKSILLIPQALPEEQASVTSIGQEGDQV